MRRTLVLVLALAVAGSTGLLAQGVSTGKISGRVAASDGSSLPGVVVTAKSSALQGEGVAHTQNNGAYVLPNLPAGTYELTFELEGFEPVVKQVKVALAQALALDVTLGLEVTETLLVTSEAGAISSGISGQSTYTQEMIEELAIARDVSNVVNLAPGVQNVDSLGRGTGLGALSIAGSQTYESLYLVNGVTLNENVRGQVLDLYIEDAVEETTVSLSGISAEYGRFAGGVINVITKSGGNDFSGSLRANLTSEDWEEKTALTTAQSDEVNETYEATLGGRLIKDRLWFFLAARDLERASENVLRLTNIAVPTDTAQDRQELKLTLSPHTSHRVVGSYLNRDEATLNEGFAPVDTSTLSDREDPQTLFSGHYTGVLTPTFFLEAQYSERDYTIGKGNGGKTTERLGGTWIVDLSRFVFVGSPVFCGVCVDQERNNENSYLKASYFLTTNNAGTHDLVAGYDTFSDIVVVENHQSGSDFHAWSVNPFIIRGNQVFPQITNNGQDLLRWTPVLDPTQGSDIEVNSLFANDTWRVNNHFTVNLGLRYDKNDAVDGGKAPVSNDSKVSPRVGVTYDLKANGNWIFNASAAQYVSPLHNGGNTSTGAARAGALANFQWLYNGPAINPDPNAPNLLTADEALKIIFDWFASIGDINNTSQLIVRSIPGFGTQLRQPLSSPHSTELSIGLSKRLGNRGMIRADVVSREFDDFYVSRTDLDTGRVQNPDGSFSDLTLLENLDSGILDRKYDGLHTAFVYRISDRLQLGANWTWSHARGNFDGETRDNGPLRSAILSYPEYKAFANNLSRGDLQVDVRHKARAYALYEIFNGKRQDLSVSLLQSFTSGHPYQAVRTINSRPFVANPGYLFPPSSVDYFFTPRGSLLTDDITQTDIGINYAIKWNAFGKPLQIFIQPEILNVLNEDGVRRVDQAVGLLAPFNPFTTAPVEGVNWRKQATFGKPTQPADFQTPRTYRFSVGFRF